MPGRNEATARPLALDVALTPAELTAAQALGPTTVAMVVDVIRATTTLTMLFDRGCARVLVAGDIPAARAFVARQPNGAYALAGEVGGRRPPGFDFGNSPGEFAASDLMGRTLVFSTTNGTRAIRAAAGARAILAGSLRNAEAACLAALSRAAPEEAPASAPQPPLLPLPAAGLPSDEAASEARVDAEARVPDLLIVCSGRGGRPSLDDAWCAGFLVERLERLAAARGLALRLREGAQMARQVCANGESAAEVFWRADAGQAVIKIGLAGDIAYCAEVDASESVPLVVGATPEGLIIMESARE